MTDGIVDRWRIALPMIDIHTIGAGGGSIARVDEGGMLQVGPQSAGARPGPACYGRGGTRADDDRRRPRARLPRPRRASCGGELRLDREAAAQRDRRARRAAARALARAGGRRHLRRRQRDDGDRRARGQRAPRPRPARLPARRRGRRRARCTPPRSPRELEIPLLVVPRESSIFCAAGHADVRLQARLRARLQDAARRARRARGCEALLRGDGGRRAGPCSRASASTRPASRCARRSICATSASGTS